MKLSDYLSENELTHSEFAESIARERSTVSKLIAGGVPDSKTMIRIIAVTDGQVQPNDFFEAQ